MSPYMERSGHQNESCHHSSRRGPYRHHCRCQQIMAEHQVNIFTINQVILDGIFNMAMIVDMDQASVDLGGLQQLLKDKGDALGVEIRAQNMEIFNAMHRVG